MKNDDLLEYLEERLACLDVDRDTRAYIVGVFHDMSFNTSKNMSDESIVLAYADATRTGNFVDFLRIADWALFSCTMFRPVEEQMLIEDLGQKSFDACYRLTNKTWPVYDELSRRLPELAEDLNRLLQP